MYAHRMLPIALALSAPWCLADPAPDGSVAELRNGTLERHGGSVWQQLAKESPLFLNDRLRTDAAGLAIIEMREIGRFVMGPSSELTVGREGPEVKAEVPRGSVWMHADLPSGSRAAITTTLAVAGIRGTRLSVHRGGDAGGLEVCVCEGRVEVTLADGSTHVVEGAQRLAVSEAGSSEAGAVSSAHLIERRSAGFEFCYNCHKLPDSGPAPSFSNW